LWLAYDTACEDPMALTISKTQVPILLNNKH